MAEVDATLIGIHDICDQTIPGRDGKLSHCHIQHGARDQEPGTLIRKQQRERQQGNPQNRLTDRAGKNQGLALTEAMQNFDGQ